MSVGKTTMTSLLSPTHLLKSLFFPFFLTFFLMLPLFSLQAQEMKEELKQPWMILRTTKGVIIIKLFEKKVPRTVAHIIGLVTGDKSWTDPKTKKQVSRPFYDGLEFFNIIPTYLIKTGCPLNKGHYGSGHLLKDEFHPDLKHRGAGIVSMANAGPNTNSSQFFITLRSTPWLDVKYVKGKFCRNFDLPFRCSSHKDCRDFAKQYPSASKGRPLCKMRVMKRGYTIFGQVVHGMKVVEKISETPVTVGGRPLTPIKIQRAFIRRAKHWSRRWLKLSGDID